MPGVLRSPLAYLLIEGEYVPVIEAEVKRTSNAASDTFTAELAMTASNEALLAEKNPLEATVVIVDDTLAGGKAQIITGTLTQVQFKFGARRITVQGKDAASKLLKQTSTESFRNKTHAEVAEEVAQRAGLKLDADSGTLKAGKTFQIDSVMLSDGQSLWSILNRIADKEGLSVFIDGDTKTVQMKKIDDENLPVYLVEYTPPTDRSYADGSFIELRIIRNLETSGKTTVRVRSRNSKEKKDITSEKEADGDGGDETVYEYRAPNLTQEQADRIAEKRLAENTRHDLGIEVEIPGDPTVKPRMLLRLTGTGTVLDQTYIIDTVDHRIGPDGSRTTINGKNKSAKRGKGSAAPQGSYSSGGG